MWLLRARIAMERDSGDGAVICYKHAIEAAQAQSSLADKLFILKEAGAFLAAYPEADVAARGQLCLDEAAAMQRRLEAEREQCASPVSMWGKPTAG